MDILKGLWGLAKHPVDEAVWWGKSIKNFVKDPSSIKDMPGTHQDMMSKNIMEPLIGKNKISQNSDAIAGAIVGGILAAPAMAGGAGASGAGGAGASGGMGGAGGASGLGWQGGAQLGLGGSYAPSTAFGQSAAAMGGSGGGTGAMGMSTAYAPTTAFGQGAAYGSTGTGGLGIGDYGRILNLIGNSAPQEQQTQMQQPQMRLGSPQQMQVTNSASDAYQALLRKYPDLLN